MKKKKLILQTSRLLLKIIFFILIPSLYIQELSAVKQIYLAIIEGTFGMDLLPQIAAVISIIPITILLGRFFCGWMCGFGAFTDFIFLISSKIFKRKVKISEKADETLKYTKYIILIFIVSVIWSFNITIFKSSNPWDVFGMLATFGKYPDFSSVFSGMLIGFIILVGIIIASVFVERFFCRYLCPIGAIFALLSLFKIGKIEKNREKCGNCRACTNSCAMSIPLYKMDVVNSPECINCMKCVSVCPRSNAKYTIAQKNVRPLIAGVACAAVIAGSYYFVGQTTLNNPLPEEQVSAQSINSEEQVSSQSANSTESASLYNDGTYEGTGKGFRNGTTKVSVVVDGGKITDINVVSFGDDKPYFNRAFSTVSKEIIEEQTPTVDAVSGATYSSKGIMSAVANALSGAEK